MSYDYNRTAATPSKFARILEKMAKDIEAELREGVGKYTGNDRGNAQVKVVGEKLHLKVWMYLGEGITPFPTKEELAAQKTKAEADELAEILLGEGAAVGQHAMVPDMWVATRIVAL